MPELSHVIVLDVPTKDARRIAVFELYGDYYGDQGGYSCLTVSTIHGEMLFFASDDNDIPINDVTDTQLILISRVYDALNVENYDHAASIIAGLLETGDVMADIKKELKRRH